MHFALFLKDIGSKFYFRIIYVIKLTYDSNACGNCKRKDHAIQCSTGDGRAQEDSDDNNEGNQKKAAQIGKAKKVEITTRSGRTTQKPTQYAA